MTELVKEETVAHMIDRYDLNVWDISHAFEVLDSLPVKVIAMNRYIERKGLNPDNAMLWHDETEMGRELRVIREEVLDDFIIYTINSFEFCYISRPGLSILSEKERRYFLDAHAARAHIYQTVQLAPELAGRFIRYQRIGKSIYLITPKP